MSATVVPPIEEVSPGLVTRIKDGDLAGAQKGLLVAGLALIGVSCIGWSREFYFSYLTAYLFGLTICLGALFFVLVQHVVRAGWSVTVRRAAEHVAGAIWIFLPLFIPILYGFDELYGHWSIASNHDAVVAGKAAYLNKPFFFVRLAIYFAAWIGMALWFKKKSIAQDESGDPAISLHLSRLAAPCLLVYALTVTFAAFDWSMSLNPHWFSTMFGICYFAGGFMAFLATAILFFKWIGKLGYLKDAVNVEHYHDIGKLMYAFVIFWTYVTFSQYMLIAYANLPEETSYFAMRQEHGWDTAFAVLAFGHFVAPFVLFMSRHVKRHPIAPIPVAIWLLAMHWVDLQYQVVPNASHGHGDHGAGGPGGAGPAALEDAAHAHAETWLGQIHWYDVSLTLGFFALVLGVALTTMRKSHLIPVRDPRLQEALNFHNI